MPRARPHLVRLAAVTSFALLVALPAAAALPGGGSGNTARDGAAGSSGEAGRTPGAEDQAARRATLPGIDVSHWQGTIDWASVADAGPRFVFMKATDDTDYVDPTFATNRAQARANGLSVGAYHFARPDPSRGDARREARHFVDVADPEPGDLLPVLDIETSQGLGHTGVTRWARTWVRVVRSLTGVTPLVYTSPYGWATRTGDTRMLARDGAPLWVAHWGVSSPTLPANGWDGNGWVVWQHTSSGHVSGIRGDVDLDRLSGTRLGTITIRRLTIDVVGGAGRVTSDPPGIGCAASCSRSVDPDAVVTLTAVPDDRAHFTGWSGACSGDALTCTVTMRTSRSVGARFVTDVQAPTATITTPEDLADAAVVRFDEPVRGVGASNPVLRDAGGSRLAVHRVCRTAAGAPVACDTAVVRSISLRPAAPLAPGRSYRVSVNPDGAESVVRDGAGNPAPSAAAMFDAARVVEQTSSAVVRSPARSWSAVRVGHASGGSYAVARREGASARIAFDGPGVDWITVTGPDRGRARIIVDGEVLRTVDLFSAERAYGVVRTVGGLGDSAHVLRIVATGHGRPASTGSAVAVDRFDVWS